MSVPMLDLAAQNVVVKQKVLNGLSTLIDRCTFVLGENVTGLEADLAGYSGAAFAVGMSSGTDALLVALMALGVGHGDEVILPSFTFFATGGVVARLGAVPVFVDIDPVTFNIAPRAVEAAITARTKAIMPVHLFGQLADMPKIMEIANSKGIPVIEDACQSLGAKGWGKSAGQFGQITGCSFYPTKNLGAFGDAGSTLIRNDESLTQKVRRLRVHGMEPVYVHHEVGMNGRLDEFQALVLRAKLPFLEGWHEGRRKNAKWYMQRMKSLSQDDLQLPLEVVPDGRHIYNQFTVRVKRGRRDKLQAHLKAQGIGSAIFYPISLHKQPCFEYLGYKKGSLPETELASEEVLSLPVYPEMTEAMLEEVAKSVLSFYNDSK
ncbi:MAG: DegT/DnrJ/EryC1/StrS family aminotransferase [Holophagales bacterium]|jgi:dTDP-4-amino-4,6-dideoxygalactose transaminase|nr:DegT/DnrJ/EryC1/StrS family aminotransferase [Holophagales bacterium]